MDGQALPPFQFKQFSVEQHRAAFKVGTDGCLLGAWASLRDPTKALDVGTGTGVIALLLAQRFPNCQITALEVNKVAASLASQNMVNSLWASRLSLVSGRFQDFQPTEQFDLIVCNPPYFEQSLRNPDEHKALARHDIDFPWPDFVCKAAHWLAYDGVLAMVLPSNRYNYLRQSASSMGLFPTRICQVAHKPGSAPKRVLVEFSAQPGRCVEQSLVLHDANGTLSADARALLRAFYLAL